ncbi:hypothetical protein QFM25_00018520, partial [Acinetobacter baumannii]
MEQSTLKEYSGSATEHMELIFSKQRANFEADPYPSLEARRTKLHKLKNSVHDKFHRTLILSGFCLLKIAKIS